MVAIESFRGNVIALDTAPFIYFFEEHPVLGRSVAQLFESLERAEFQAVTSTITLLEVLVHPIRKKQFEVAERYRSILLTADNLTTVPVLAEIAEIAAQLRALHSYKTPDALQLATAIHMGAQFFITNDRTLQSNELLKVVLVTDLS